MEATNEGPVEAEVKNNDVYAEALLAEPIWWRGLNNVIESIVV